MSGRPSRSAGKRPVTSTSSSPPSKKGSTSAQPSNWPIFQPCGTPALVSEAYSRLERLKVVSTKFFDHALLHTLGLADDIRIVFERVGWGDFYHAHPLTYVKPTREFLTTFFIEPDTQTVHFKLHGVSYKRSYAQLASYCGLPEHEGLTNFDDFPASYREPAFWAAITDNFEYHPNHLKASRIVNPCLRLIHRLLNCVFFAKQEVGAADTDDLFILWVLVMGHGTVTLSPGHWIAYTLAKARTQKSGAINVGGLVTMIIDALNIEPCEASDLASGSALLNFNTLQTMQMLSRHDRPHTDQFNWLVGHPPTILYHLPNPSRTTLAVAGNYLFPPFIGHVPAHLEEDVPLEDAPMEDAPSGSWSSHFRNVEDQLMSLRYDHHALSSRFDAFEDQQNLLYGMVNAFTEFQVSRHPDFEDPHPALVAANVTRRVARLNRAPPPSPYIPGPPWWGDQSGPSSGHS